ELGLAVPGGRRARAADRARAAGPGRGPGARCGDGGSRLLLRLVRRLAVAGLAIAAALTPQVVLAHAQLLQSDPAPNALLQTVPASVPLLCSAAVAPPAPGLQACSPSG